MKRAAVLAVAKLETAYALASVGGNDDDTAYVAEELSRGWARRKAFSRALYYASRATRLAPGQKSGWATLAKACELVAMRTKAVGKRRRAVALYRAAATAFRKAASLTKDAEDKRWLLELASDAARRAETPPA